MESMVCSTDAKRTVEKAQAGMYKLYNSHKGQASVEFAVVLFAFLALLSALAALADFSQSGLIAEHAARGASHAVGNGDTGAWADVLAY